MWWPFKRKAQKPQEINIKLEINGHIKLDGLSKHVSGKQLIQEAQDTSTNTAMVSDGKTDVRHAPDPSMFQEDVTGEFGQEAKE